MKRLWILLAFLLVLAGFIAFFLAPQLWGIINKPNGSIMGQVFCIALFMFAIMSWAFTMTQWWKLYKLTKKLQ